MAVLSSMSGGEAPIRPHRLTTWADRLVLPLFCLAIFWRGLFAWFQADDFAWLSLRLELHDGRSLLHALFAPMAEGTVRPLSERAFFLIFESLFGLNALPFRIWVFLTQCANLWLLTAVGRRLTGSPEAGFCAAILWMVNSGLALAMVWTSAYNQILCSFFLLGAFWFLLRYIERGRRRDCLWQWALFLMGFGALEINVVYPALAALYTYLRARKLFRTTLALFVPSLFFTAAHQIAGQPHIQGVYALHFDRAMLQTLVTYCFRALVPFETLGTKTGLGLLVWFLLAGALVAFTVVRIRQNDWLPVFCFGWFAIVLAPVLPLRDHISTYYLTTPTIGLAVLGGDALARAWRAGVGWRAGVAILASIYALLMLRFDRMEIIWWQQRSLAVQSMVLGVLRAHQLHPEKAFLLNGVDTQLFRAGVYHHPFAAVGVNDVYLTPGSAAHIDPLPGETPPQEFELPDGPVVHGLNLNQILVYQVGPKRLRAVTSVYENTVAPRLSADPPRRIDAANRLTAYLLGPHWYQPDDRFRWMPRDASFRIGGPRSPSEKLHLHGFCSPTLLQERPVALRVTVDGTILPEFLLKKGDANFEISLPLPSQALGKPALQVTLEVDHALRAGRDQNEFGLRFGTFEVW